MYESNELIQDHVCGWKIDRVIDFRAVQSKKTVYFMQCHDPRSQFLTSQCLCACARPLNCFFSTYLCDSENKIDIELKVFVTFSVNYYNLCRVLVSFLSSTGRSIFSHDTFALRIKDGGKFK